MTYFLFALFFIASSCAGFLFWKLWVKTMQFEQLQAYTSELETITLEQRTMIEKLWIMHSEAHTRLKEIDIKGAFEADDEVGFVFKYFMDVLKQIENVYNGKKDTVE